MRERYPIIRSLLLLCTGLCLFSPLAAGQEYYFASTIQHKNLTIHPIISFEQNAVASFITLDEGLSSGLVQIEETGSGIEQQNQAPDQRSRQRNPAEQTEQPTPTSHERQVPGQLVEEQIGEQIEEQVQQLQVLSTAARVNSLRVVNNSDSYLFIAAGEIIKGGRQNRVASKDSIIAPNENSVELGVFCVEQGRWHEYENSGSKFSSEKGLIAQNALRKTILSGAEQGAVWDKVAALNKAQGISSETDNYLEGIEESGLRDTAHEYLKSLLPELSPEGKLVSGIIVEIGGKIEGLDLYFDPQLFKKHAEKILLAYAYDAALQASGVPTAGPGELRGKGTVETAETFLQRALTAERLTDITKPTYRYMRLEGDGLSGGLLQLNSSEGFKDVHMTVIPAEIE